MTQEQAEDVVFNKLGICGCGRPEHVLTFVHTALRLLADRTDRNLDGGSGDEWNVATKKVRVHFGDDESPLYWMAWYLLDHADLTGHGGGVTGSWPSAKGREFLAYLDEHGVESIFAN